MMRKARSGTQLAAYDSLVRQMRGKVILDDGATYEGEWANNKRDGQGKQLWPDGSSYNGQWKEGRMDGHGTYTYSNGN